MVILTHFNPEHVLVIFDFDKIQIKKNKECDLGWD